jgi:hypothetical protein
VTNEVGQEAEYDVRGFSNCGQIKEKNKTESEKEKKKRPQKASM